jgi:hypothetical protein
MANQLVGFTGWNAVSVNLTAADPSADGYLTAWPCDQTRPDTSAVNFARGGASSTHAIVSLSASMTFCVYASQDTDVIVDVFGGFLTMDNPIVPARLRLITPQRIFDSRSTPGPIPSGSVTRIKVPNALVQGVVAGVVNITAVSPATSGYITVFACLSGRTDVSNLNFEAGESAQANGAIVPIDLSRHVCLKNEGDTEILVDVFAMFDGVNNPGLLYQAAAPVRLLDTRSGVGGWRGQASRGETLELAIPGEGAMAVGNVTVVGAQGDGYLTMWNGEGTPPNISNLNFAAGASIPNFAVSEISAGGIAIHNGDAGGHHVLFDLTGWFVNDTAWVDPFGPQPESALGRIRTCAHGSGGQCSIP